MSIFKKKFENVSAAEEWEARVPRHQYPEFGERSKTRVAYECPHCFSPDVYRDRELEWHCTVCGFRFCYKGEKKDHFPNPLSEIKDTDGNDPPFGNPLHEKLRRKIALEDEENKLLSAFFLARVGGESELLSEPEHNDREYFIISGLRIPIVVDPSALRIPHECPRCLGKALFRDERLIWHCACGLKFYFNDRHEHFYTANTVNERHLLKDYDSEAKRAELERRKSEKAEGKSKYDEYTYLHELLMN